MNKLKKHGIYYDSRIKLLLILLTSALAFALGGGLTGLLLFGVVSLFALLSGLWKTSIKFAIVYIVLLMLAQVLPIHLSSVITFFLLRILTIALALNILFQTTEISELIAALQASHIPQVIVIPVAIILRFLPSLKQDVLYIKQGMKTRGVGLSFWRIISHPAQTYEGFLIPILMRLLMTATELSASAETRGISYPCEKTHYILVDFRLRDSILLIGMLALLRLSYGHRSNQYHYFKEDLFHANRKQKRLSSKGLDRYSSVIFVRTCYLYSLCVSVFFSVHDVSGKPIVGTTSCYYLLSCSSQN